MEAAAHTKGGYGGVPQSVGNDFVSADKKKGIYQGGAGNHARKLHERGKAQAAAVMNKRK